GADGRASVVRCFEAASDLCGVGAAAVCRTVAAPAPVARVMTVAATSATGAAARSRAGTAAKFSDASDGEGKRRCTVAPPLPLAPGPTCSTRVIAPGDGSKRPHPLGGG